MFRKLLLITGLLLGIAGFGLFAATGWYVWAIKAEVNRQGDSLATKANATADAADHALGFVRDVIGRAEAELSTAREQPFPSGRPRAPVNFAVQIAAIRASQDLVGSVERAQGAVLAASDAVVVVNAALNVAGNYPELSQLFGFTPEQIGATQSTLGSVADELQHAKGILSISPELSQLTPEQLYAIDDTLGRVKGLTAQMAEVVNNIRTRVNETRASVEAWSRWIAIGVTFASALGALGQVFLARFCWRKLRHRVA